MRRSTRDAASRLLQSFVDDELSAVDELAWFRRYLRRYFFGFSEADLDDLFQDVLLEIVVLAREAAPAEPEELLDAFTRVGERLRQRRKRQRRRMRELTVPMDDLANKLAGFSSVDGSLIFAELYERFSVCLFEAVASELPQLADNDHDTLSRANDLVDDFPPRGSRPPERSAEAERKARYRARCRLRERLEGFLLDKLRAVERETPVVGAPPPQDKRFVLELALEFVGRSRDPLGGLS